MSLSEAVEKAQEHIVCDHYEVTVAGVLCVQVKGSVKGRVDMRVYETVLVQTMNASPEFWGLAESMG